MDAPVTSPRCQWFATTYKRLKQWFRLPAFFALRCCFVLRCSEHESKIKRWLIRKKMMQSKASVGNLVPQSLDLVSGLDLVAELAPETF